MSTHRAKTTVEARNKLLAEQAEYARLKTARLRGQLLDADAVRSRWGSAIVKVRARILSVPNRLAGAPGWTAKHVEALDAELRQALGELADEAHDQA